MSPLARAAAPGIAFGAPATGATADDPAVGDGEAGFGGERFRQHRAIVGMVALAEPQAGNAMSARFTRFSRRFAEQALSEMLRELQFADTRATVQEQRVRPAGTQLLKTGPVVGLPRIDHEKSFGSGVCDVILQVLIYFNLHVKFNEFNCLLTIFEVFSSSVQCCFNNQEPSGAETLK